MEEQEVKQESVETTQTKGVNTNERSQRLKNVLKTFVENPDNFLDGSLSVREIARKIGYSNQATMKNILVMYNKNLFTPNVVIIEGAKLCKVFCRHPNAVKSNTNV